MFPLEKDIIKQKILGDMKKENTKIRRQMNKQNWAGTFKNMFFFMQNVGKLRIP